MNPLRQRTLTTCHDAPASDTPIPRSRPDDTYREAPDHELMAGVTGRSELALEEVVARNSRAVFGLAKRLLGDASLAEDICQDVFVRVWQFPERFTVTRSPLRTMVLTHTHGMCVDLIRSRNARVRREERVAVGRRPEAPGIDSALLSDATLTHVRAALDDLPPGERRVIELAYFGAHTYREVARLLGMPEGTAKAKIRSGLRQLHHSLDRVGVRAGDAALIEC